MFAQNKSGRDILCHSTKIDLQIKCETRNVPFDICSMIQNIFTILCITFVIGCTRTSVSFAQIIIINMKQYFITTNDFAPINHFASLYIYLLDYKHDAHHTSMPKASSHHGMFRFESVFSSHIHTHTHNYVLDSVVDHHRSLNPIILAPRKHSPTTTTAPLWPPHHINQTYTIYYRSYTTLI